MRLNALATRFLLISAIGSLVALVVTALLLTAYYQANAERNFRGLLTAHLYNLMGAVDIDADGRLTGSPDLGDPMFKQPYSGWYWLVEPKERSGTADAVLKSASMAGETLETPPDRQTPFQDGFLRSYRVEGFQEEQLTVAEAQIFLGEGDAVYRFLVTGNNAALASEISGFTRSLVIFLALFGFGVIIATLIATRIGLRPLDRATQALNAIRKGEADHLEGEFPHEIKPLVNEVNALIETNKAVLERARTQVGNLAHALKTPISVLKNEAQSHGGALGSKVDEQVDRMQDHVQRYLNRARIAARGRHQHDTNRDSPCSAASCPGHAKTQSASGHETGTAGRARSGLSGRTAGP